MKFTEDAIVPVAGIRRAVRRHVEEEAAGFAADLGRKLEAETALLAAANP
jgi:hypothetical protein